MDMTEDRADADSRPDPAIRYVAVTCGSKRALISVDRLKEVITPQSLTPVPGSGPEVCGLVGLRGRVVTVFDLGVLLGAPPLDLGLDYRVLVVEVGDSTIGLAVAEVVTMVDNAPASSIVGAEPGSQAPPVLDLDRLVGPKLA